MMLKRKVAIFLNQHMPLSEVFVLHQAQALKRYTPHFVACQSIRNSVEHAIPLTALNTHNRTSERIHETLFKVTGISPKLENAVRDSDIIHAHFGPTGWLASPLASRTRKPLVVTLHGFDVLKNHLTFKDDGLMQALYKKFLNRLTSRASAFVCVSEYLKDRAIAFGFPADKCHVAYMGIPLKTHTERKYIRSDISLPFRILAVGRLVPMKGHHHLITAVAALQNEGYNVQLDILGDGPLKQDLQKHANSLGLTNFRLWGGQPHDVIQSMMRQSDIFCHLSHGTENGYNEAFGLAVIEAQWAGLPVVAYKSGGVPEGIDNEKTGILCLENDISAVKQAISALITNDDLRQSMSVAASAFVRQHFDNNVTTRKLEDIYDTAIG